MPMIGCHFLPQPHLYDLSDLSLSMVLIRNHIDGESDSAAEADRVTRLSN